MTKIKNIKAYEILDSRGNPTVETQVTLDDETMATAAVPSGASTGDKEALELRDGREDRFGGKGVLTACENIEKIIFPHLKKIDPLDQKTVDQTMLELDGTENKSRLGANAILAVSLAVCRAGSLSKKIPLWQHIQETYHLKFNKKWNYPALMMNVINGGAHADSGLDIQEYMFVISGMESFFDRLQAGSELYHLLKKNLQEDHFRVAIGDEGGFAPHLSSNEEPLARMHQVAKSSHYRVGTEVTLGLDVAASEFYDEKENNYEMRLDIKSFDASQLADLYCDWMEKYPLRLIEDPFDQNDWTGWKNFTQKNQDQMIIIGDDLLVTNEKLLREAAKQKACNTALIKVNQIGSLTETIQTINAAREEKMKIAVSHRSGETTDDFIADLAVATNADFVKFGAPARGDRVAKYNRIAHIERLERK